MFPVSSNGGVYMPMEYPFGDRWGDYLRPKTRKDSLRTSLMNILITRKGEKVMRSDFGAGLEDEVFEPLDDTESLRLMSIVGEEVTKWDPRMEVVDVRVSSVNNNEVSVKVTYKDTGSGIFEEVELSFVS